MRSIAFGIRASRLRLMWMAVLLALIGSQAIRVRTQTNLVAAWAFNEGTGTSADDRSTNSNVGTLQGAGWTTGKYGGGVAFDGVDDYVSVADDNTLDLSSALTILAWVYPDYSTAARTLVRKEAASGGLAYSLSLTSDSKVRLEITIGSSVYTVTGSTTVLDGEWTHVAATYDGFADEGLGKRCFRRVGVAKRVDRDYQPAAEYRQRRHFVALVSGETRRDPSLQRGAQLYADRGRHGGVDRRSDAADDYR